MRIIKTEILFAPGQIQKVSNRSASLNPGITFAFLEGDKNFEMNFERYFYESDLDVGQVIFTQNIHIERRPKDIDYYENALRMFIDAALKGAALTSLSSTTHVGSNRLELSDVRDYVFSNDGFIEQILETNIVVEHSPPEWLPVSRLLKFGPVIGGGMAIGVYATSQPLILITVPFGIIVMGSAVAVAKAFEKGLPRVIDAKLFGRRRGRP